MVSAASDFSIRLQTSEPLNLIEFLRRCCCLRFHSNTSKPLKSISAVLTRATIETIPNEKDNATGCTFVVLLVFFIVERHVELPDGVCLLLGCYCKY
jgi:hypothetical protein